MGHERRVPVRAGGPASTAILASAAVAVSMTVLAGAGTSAAAPRTGGTTAGASGASGAYRAASIAGDGTAGYTGDGGPAAGATLDGPQGVTVDAAGNLVIADTGNSVIRVAAGHDGTFYGVAMTTGDIYTIGGTGTPGYTGDGKPAARAELNGPQGVTIDGSGNVVLADTGNYRVRVIAAGAGAFYGVAMIAGTSTPWPGAIPRGSSAAGRPPRPGSAFPTGPR